MQEYDDDGEEIRCVYVFFFFFKIHTVRYNKYKIYYISCILVKEVMYMLIRKDNLLQSITIYYNN